METQTNPTTSPKGTVMTLNQLLFTVGPVVNFEGRWFVTAGNAGFNCTKNNCGGWPTKKAAEAAVKRFSKTSPAA
jgi:hypothetical protein